MVASNPTSASAFSRAGRLHNFSQWQFWSKWSAAYCKMWKNKILTGNLFQKQWWSSDSVLYPYSHNILRLFHVYHIYQVCPKPWLRSSDTLTYVFRVGWYVRWECRKVLPKNIFLYVVGTRNEKEKVGQTRRNKRGLWAAGLPSYTHASALARKKTSYCWWSSWLCTTN